MGVCMTRVCGRVMLFTYVKNLSFFHALQNGGMHGRVGVCMAGGYDWWGRGVVLGRDNQRDTERRGRYESYLECFLFCTALSGWSYKTIPLKNNLCFALFLTFIGIYEYKSKIHLETKA